MCLEVLYCIDHVCSSDVCVCCACDPIVRLDAPSIYFVCVVVCRKLSSHLRVLELDHGCLRFLCWKTSLVIPISKPGEDSSQGTSYRPISLLCPTAKVLEALILPSINEFLSPAKDKRMRI